MGRRQGEKADSLWPLWTTISSGRRWVLGFPGAPVVRTSSSKAGDMGSIPGEGAKIPHASWPKNWNIKQKQYCRKFNKDFKKMVHIKKILKNKRLEPCLPFSLASDITWGSLRVPVFFFLGQLGLASSLSWKWKWIRSVVSNSLWPHGW